MKKTVIILSLIFFCTLLVAQNQPKGQYVVMLSLDGFRADYPEKYQAKNLLSIAKKGVRVKRMIPSNPTKTFPNHYTLVTGLYPDHHGLIGNSFYAPDLKKTYAMRDRESVENGDFYGGEPIWNTALKAGLQTASYFWVGSEAKIKGMQPNIWKKYDGKVSFELRIDSVISWLQLPYNKRPRLVTLYYDEPDHSGHLFGADSKQVAEQVRYTDEQVGNLYRKLMQLPIADSLNFIVLSDHGMRNTSKEKEIVLADFINPKWIEGAYGGNPVYVINAKNGRQEIVYKALRKIKHLKVFKSKEMPARWNFGQNVRAGDFFVVAKKGWSVFLGKKRKFDFRGTHGYLNNDKQMAALFVATGAAFKNGYTQRRIKNVDVYNLIAKILGIAPAPNDGKFRRVKRLLRKKS